jgi:hypothetical protein
MAHVVMNKRTLARPSWILLGLLLGLALALDLPAANGQATRYPDKPVKIFVGFAAGGGTDVAARILRRSWLRRWVNRSWWRTAPARAG